MPLHLAERDATAFLVHSRRGNEQRATAKKLLSRATADNHKQYFNELNNLFIL